MRPTGILTRSCHKTTGCQAPCLHPHILSGSDCFTSCPLLLSGGQLGLVNGDRIRRSECKRRDVGLFIDSNCRTSYLLCPLENCLPQILVRFAACFLQILPQAFFFMRSLLTCLKLPPVPSSIRPRSCFIFLHSNSHQLKLLSSPFSPK